MRALALLAAFSLAISAFAQDPVRFIVTGDGRWNTKTPREGIDENGVNVAGMTRLATAIVAEKPKVLLFSGDLVGGAETDEAEKSQFDTWLKVMSPIYDAGITVLAARGNHEMHCPHAADVWSKVFTGRYALPQNGPKGEEGMTYAYTLGNVLFLSLDEFQSSSLGINQPWLEQTLSQPHPPHVFAFAHKMAFFSGNHDDGLFTVPDQRDKMLQTLAAAGSRTVFFGHDHLYDHVEASTADLAGDKSIHQLVVGTAGAPFVKGKTLPKQDGKWTLNRIAHDENRLGYCVVDVDGLKVHVAYKAESEPGVFKTIDEFFYELKS